MCLYLIADICFLAKSKFPRIFFTENQNKELLTPFHCMDLFFYHKTVSMEHVIGFSTLFTEESSSRSQSRK